MIANQRMEVILDMIKVDGHIKVAKLSNLFNVNKATIMQDLEILEKEGFMIREHGGAYLKNFDKQVKSIRLQNQNNLNEKRAIARTAIRLIEDGDAIILDSGSTITEIANLLHNFKNLTVITSALNIAFILGGKPGIKLIVTGGEFKAPTHSLTGQKAADFFQNLHVDKLFLATAGFSLKSGITYPDISDICLKRAMIESADEVFLVADSTKIGKKYFASLGALSLIDYLITDSKINESDLAIFKQNDIRFHIAEIE